MNRYFFSFQETLSVVAKSREEAENIIYGAEDGVVQHHDGDYLFVFDEEA